MYQFHWIVVEMFPSETQPYGGAGGKTKMITSISGDRPLKNMNVSKVSIDVELLCTTPGKLIPHITTHGRCCRLLQLL